MQTNRCPISEKANYTFDFSTLPSSVLTDRSASNWSRIVIKEQWKINQIHSNNQQSICDFEFYKRAREFTKEDLYNKSNLLQFLLILNHNDENFKIPFIFVGRPDTSCWRIGLSECGCRPRSEVTWTSSRKEEHTNKRVEDEDRFFMSVPNELCENKHIPLVFTAIGAGGCLQEWIILCNFILMGFTRFEIHIVEDDRTIQSEVKYKYTYLQTFFEEFPGISACVFKHGPMSEFASKGIVSDVVVALDWDLRAYVKEEDKPKILISERGFSFYTKYPPQWKIEKQKAENKQPLLPQGI